MIGTNKFLQITMRKETAFGDTEDLAGDVSDGVLLRPLEEIPLDQFAKELIGDVAIKRGWDDAGLPGVQGLSTAVIPISLRMTGNTRNVGALSEDGMSKVLNWAAGTRRAPGDDAVEAASTATVIKLTGHSYQVWDVVMINDEAALVVDTDTDEITIAPALSAAPDAPDDVIGMESFFITTATTPDSVGLGVTRTGDAEWEWAGWGGMVTKVEFGEIMTGGQPELRLEVALANHAPAAITHSTTEIPTATQVIGAVDAGGLVMEDAGGAHFAPILASASAGMGLDASYADGIGPNSVGGRAAIVLSPQDGTVATIKVLQDPANTITTKLNALIGSSFPLKIQINKDLGQTFGIVYPEATFTKPPTASSAGNAKAVEFEIKAGTGVIFRG